MTSISIWGLHAQRFVECHASARVAAVFSRSLYLESAGDFVCIGDPSIGRGPLNAVLDLAAWAQLTTRPPPQGKSASIVQGVIRIGMIALDTTGAERWHPTAWPPAARRKGDVQALRRLQGLAAEQAPRDGLARTVLGLLGDPCSALERVALARVELLRAWIAARQSALPPIDLLGLGPGLTPSGDDVLCGVLVALHAVGWPDLAGDLHAQIAKAAPLATSSISAAFLRAAAEGLGCEALHEAISVILEGHTEVLAGHIEALGRIGHTSGWDVLGGAVLVLQAFGTMQGQRASVASAGISE